MTNDRWEHGSEFHWPDIPSSPAVEPPWAGRGTFFGSGRDALRALVEHGRDSCGWRRFWMPSYFCQEVVDAAASAGVELSFYPDAPTGMPDFSALKARSGDALFLVNYFGLRARVTVPEGIAIVEDHTHDPWSEWSRRSDADYCVASLRKTLAIPDGGVVWSPRQRAPTPPRTVTIERSTASASKMSGMLLKRLYLEGVSIPKETFRALQLSGEASIASGKISGMPPLTEALLDVLPVAEWRSQRRRNHRLFCERFESSQHGALSIIHPEPDVDAVPFSIVLTADSAERREVIRRALIEQRVYPAVLWPLEGLQPSRAPEAHIDLSRRMLSIHCDFRYTEADILRLTDCVLAAEAKSV
jgi:hypothetical protein